MRLVNSSKGKRQTVHDLSLARCPSDTCRQKWRKGTVAWLQVRTNNGQCPDNHDVWPPTHSRVRKQDHPDLDSHRPNSQHFSTAASIQITQIGIVRIQITWSTFFWIQFTQDPIARHNSGWQYRIMHCWTFSTQNQGVMDGVQGVKNCNNMDPETLTEWKSERNQRTDIPTYRGRCCFFSF